jgi:hypothetical protein
MSADECMASLEALVAQQREQIAQQSADVRDLAERWRREPQVDGSSMETRSVRKVIFVQPINGSGQRGWRRCKRGKIATIGTG